MVDFFDFQCNSWLLQTKHRYNSLCISWAFHCIDMYRHSNRYQKNLELVQFRQHHELKFLESLYLQVCMDNYLLNAISQK